jgi:matrixin
MKRMLLVVTLLISTVGAGVASRVLRPSAGPAFAGAPQSGALLNAHWANHSLISVWIDRQNLPPRADQLVERAMRTWTTAANGSFTLRRTFLAREAGIRIYFNGANGNYGETRPRVDPATGFINSADVAIAADAPIEVDATTRDIIVYLTALHELGHALGLEHTANFDDIMYLFRQPGDGPRYFGNYRKLLRSADDIGTPTATGLSAYDLATLQKLYR